MSDLDFLQSDKFLQCIRIELNAHTTIFLYYKTYPKADSKRFPQNRTAIVFYFDSDNINEQVLKTYLNLAGQIDKLELGNYVNQKGYKNQKGKIVNFAIVKFVDEESLSKLLDQKLIQKEINEFIEIRRNRKLQLNYETIPEEEEEDEEVDEDGFVTVRSNGKVFIK
jgi:hypothetical protein